MNTSNITREILDSAFTYEAYRQLADELLAQNKTTGDNHSEAMLNYTRLNNQRMKRLDKTTKLTEETLATLQGISQPVSWLVITEAWCGDAAQIIPVIQKMAEQNPLIELKLILRDENLPVMDQFLTNGGRSIPVVIFMNAETLEVFGHWGPRPAEVQAMVMDAKAKALATTDTEEKKQIWDETKTATQLWYNKDKTFGIQSELLAAFTQVTSTISE